MRTAFLLIVYVVLTLSHNVSLAHNHTETRRYRLLQKRRSMTRWKMRVFSFSCALTNWFYCRHISSNTSQIELWFICSNYKSIQRDKTICTNLNEKTERQLLPVRVYYEQKVGRRLFLATTCKKNKLTFSTDLWQKPCLEAGLQKVGE